MEPIKTEIPVEPDPNQIIREEFEERLQEFTHSQEKLTSSLRKMHRIGEYPSPPKSVRFSLPDEREGRTHKFELGAGDKKVEMYVSTGRYTDDGLGEIFMVAGKEGSLVSGMMDSFATMFSIALQHGVPIEHLIEKLKFTRFEPEGMVPGPVRNATSIVDYIAKWLELRFKREPKLPEE